MGLHAGSKMLLGFALSCFVLASLGATPQTAPKTQEKTKDQLEQLIYSVKGPTCFALAVLHATVRMPRVAVRWRLS